MQQRRVGATGLTVSRLGLGLMTWGSATDEHEARDQLVSFLDAGGTLLDTAHVYGQGASEALLGSLLGNVVARDQLVSFLDAGGTLLDTAHVYGQGASEELLGSLLGNVVARDEVVIATKAGFGLRRGSRRYDASRGNLLASLDQSLRRLGVDHVDLWQVHIWDDQTPIEETMAALDTAVATGRTSYVGVSNYSGWQTAQAATWQRAVPGRTPLASTQMEYSLLNRRIEDEVLPAAAALGLGVLPYSPLGRGVLTGKYRTGIPSDSRGASDHASFVEPYLDDRSSGIVEAVARAADGLGLTALEVALAWVRDRPGVTAPIIGARTAVQLRAALGVEELSLPAEITAALDDVSAD